MKNKTTIIEKNKLPKLFKAKDLNYMLYKKGEQDYAIVLTALYEKDGKKYALTPTLKILEEYEEIEPNHVEEFFTEYKYSTGVDPEDFYMNDDYKYVSSKLTGASFDITLFDEGFYVDFEINGDKLLKPTGFVSLNEIQGYEKHANIIFQENFKYYLELHKEDITREEAKKAQKRKDNAKTYDNYPTL